jgi:hypothetical protein
VKVWMIRLCAYALPLVAAPSSLAFAAQGGGTGPAGSSEVVFLCEITLLLAFGRLLGEAMLRIGQPAVMGQLIAGILTCSMPYSHGGPSKRR